jgi:hypothetical protein
MAIEIINNWSFFLRLVTRETKALEITIELHSSKIVLNIISSSTNLIIIGLYLFILHTPLVDWHIKSLHFETPKENTLKCKAFFLSIFGKDHDYHLGLFRNDLKSDQCM